MTDVIEGTAVEEPGTELATAQPPANLFKGETPAQVLQRARETAEAFKPIVASHSVSIQNKQHITVEGWQTLGAMLGVTPVCVWTKKLDNGWEARVEARTLDGRVIGAAEAECLRDEGRWRTADDYAVRSMAQTRATSKALASVLRFVATLAGAEGTPAEEMPRDGGSSAPTTGFASDKQRNYFESLLKKAGGSPPTISAIGAYLETWSTGAISDALDRLKDGGKDVAKQLALEANDWLSQQTDVPGETDDLPPSEQAVGAAPEEMQL